MKAGSVAPYALQVGAEASAKASKPVKRAAAAPAGTSTAAKKSRKKVVEKEEVHDIEDVDEDRGAGSGLDGTGMTGAAEKKVIKVLLANKFELEGKKDPTGWWVSEKRASASLLFAAITGPRNNMEDCEIVRNDN